MLLNPQHDVRFGAAFFILFADSIDFDFLFLINSIPDIDSSLLFFFPPLCVLFALRV